MAGEGEPLAFVPHARQQEEWDCGLTCCFMVCRYFGLKVEKAELVKQIGTKSTWSIDLTYLLRAQGLAVQLCTITVGMDESLADTTFYRDEWDDDKQRVHDLFAGAHKAGVGVQKRSLSADEFVSLLRRGCILIVLLDNRKFSCKRCRSCMRSIARLVSSAIFTGHFVVLCGLADRSHYVAVDPSSNDEYCLLSRDEVEAARKSHGTDEDIIIIDPAAQSMLDQRTHAHTSRALPQDQHEHKSQQPVGSDAYLDVSVDLDVDALRADFSSQSQSQSQSQSPLELQTERKTREPPSAATSPSRTHAHASQAADARAASSQQHRAVSDRVLRSASREFAAEFATAATFKQADTVVRIQR